jgi:adenylate cyclase
MTDRLPSEQVITYLNDYFGIMATEVQKQSGEVLKFIGDGMLAVFDIEGSARDKACCQAIHAAIGAANALATLNKDRAEKLNVRMALHLGEVVYGNIGAADRLDFTVIGHAVNLVARLAALCAELDRPIVISDAVARLARRELLSLGRFELKGVDALQEAFTILR